jgi:hypothetical protein
MGGGVLLCVCAKQQRAKRCARAATLHAPRMQQTNFSNQTHSATSSSRPNKFGTTFTEMDAMSGRQQTTRGVWMAK